MTTGASPRTDVVAGRSTVSVRRAWRWPDRWLGPVWVWALLLIVFSLCSVFVESFATTRNLSNVLVNAVPLGLVAVGVTFVILTGNIDLSVAALISMSVTACLGILDGGEGNLALAITVPVAAGALVGFGNGLLVTKLHVPSFMVTLGTALIVQGVVFAYTDQATFGSASPGLIDVGFGSWLGIPRLVVLFVPICVLSLIFQNATRVGRYFYAVGDDEMSARLRGIPADAVKVVAFVVSGATAALAGLALATRTGGGEPLAGTGFDWDSIAAVVIGGTLIRGGRGGVGGTLVAVVLLSVVNSAMNLMGFNTFWQSAIKGLIVFSAILISALALRRPVDAVRRIAEARRSRGRT